MLTAAIAVLMFPLVALVLAHLVGAMPCASSDWLPSTDADLDSFAQNFNTLITAAPATYGLVAGDATAFDPIADAYTSALATATNPPTRTSVTIAAKDTARFNVKASLRELAAKVQASPTVTDGAKTALGLTVRDLLPTPIPAPATFPLLSIVKATPLAMDLRFADSETPDSRSKPADVTGMELFVEASTTPITDPEQIDYEAVVTRNPVPVTFAAGDVGKTAYIAGRWINAKGDRGPWSSIVSMTVAA